MKKTFYFLLLAVALVACNPTTTTDTGTTTPADSNAHVVTEPKDSVKADSAVVAVDSGTTSTPETDPAASKTNNAGRQANPNIDLNAKHFSVSGHILLQGSYCGGAAPSPEMEAEARRPKPYANQGFLIRDGKVNKLGTAMITRTRTDANGNFKLDLKPGTYCMVLEEKESARDAGFYTQKYLVVDKPCDQKWLGTCDLTFTVADKNISGLRLTLTKKCNITSLSPCITWDGPLPPAAAPRKGS